MLHIISSSSFPSASFVFPMEYYHSIVKCDDICICHSVFNGLEVIELSESSRLK